VSTSESEVRRFLASSMVVRLATLSPKGLPLITPIWFVPVGVKLYIPTGIGALAVRNIEAHPKVVALFDAERDPAEQRVLRLHGTATWKRIRPSLPLVLRYARKYYLCSGGVRAELAHIRQWALRSRYYGQGDDGALIEIKGEEAEFLPRFFEPLGRVVEPGTAPG